MLRYLTYEYLYEKYFKKGGDIMPNQEFRFLMTDVLHSPHHSLAEYMTYDRLAHLYALIHTR